MKTFRALMTSVLSLALSIPQFAAGAGRSPSSMTLTPQHTERFFAGLERTLAAKRTARYLPMAKSEIKHNIKAGLKEMTQFPAQWAAHTGQTFTLLWILASIEAVRQQAKMKPLQAQTDSNLQIISNVGSEMVNNFEILSSMVGASAINVPMTKPLELINQLIGSKVTSPYMAKLLGTGAASFVTFVGWEAGSRLWQEATLQLEDEQDIKIAQNLKFTEILRGRASADDQRVFRLVFRSAFEILLFGRPELTKNWIYNTWRLNIATGDFITTLTAMVAAGVAAGSLAPGAGNFLGFVFGLVGGLAGGAVAIMIPHYYKATITDGIRRLRIDYAKAGLLANRKEIQEIADDYSNRSRTATLPRLLATQLQDVLNRRRALREQMGTVYMEQIYEAYVRLQEADVILSLIESLKEPKKAVAVNQDSVGQATANAEKIESLAAEMKAQRQEASERLYFYFFEFIDLQNREGVNVLGKYIWMKTTPPEIKDVLDQEMEKLMLVQSSLRHVLAGIFPEQKEKLGLEHLSAEDLQKAALGGYILINVFYLESFQEKLLM